MILIAGLGNPGERYKKTRHNVGFTAVDEFARKNDFPDFKLSKKYNGLISEKTLGEEKIILVKPQTFMNDSGKAVSAIIKNYKLKNENLFAIHDDMDIAIGKIKIISDRGAAGHKGVESIIGALGTKNFTRFRVGIKPAKGEKPVKAEKIVLQKFNKEEEKIIKGAIEETVNAIETALNEGIEKAMQKYNR